MKCEIENLIRITQGSKETIIVRLTDLKTNERLDLSGFDGAKAIFKTSAGATVEKSITVPGDDPKLGVLSFDLLSAETALFDQDMSDFEIELTYTSDDENLVFVLKNSIEVIERI